jgi:fumarylacetoacetate (FAA) hydrolase
MKLVTYSPAKKKQTVYFSGMLWGEWILPFENIIDYMTNLKIPVSPKIRKSFKDEQTIIELIGKGQGFLDELQKLSWRFFNRIKPEKIRRSLTNIHDVILHAPIPHPPVLRDFYAFEQHVKNARARRGLDIPAEWYEFAAFYYSNPTVIYGPEQDVPKPGYTEKLDFELEIACVIGEEGTDIPLEKAANHIAGYMIMNDWSARDVQVGEMKVGLGPAKAKDFATSLGPWIVTPDELEDRTSKNGKLELDMMVRVNGKELSRGNAASMHWSFPQMVARASQSVMLHSGEVFGSGTMGNGSLLELGENTHRWLKHDDIVELEIERLGVLRNRIIQSKKTSRLER